MEADEGSSAYSLVPALVLHVPGLTGLLLCFWTFAGSKAVRLWFLAESPALSPAPRLREAPVRLSSHRTSPSLQTPQRSQGLPAVR
jgi:hypothetical protein